jgi:hypothetical protein
VACCGGDSSAAGASGTGVAEPWSAGSDGRARPGCSAAVTMSPDGPGGIGSSGGGAMAASSSPDGVGGPSCSEGVAGVFVCCAAGGPVGGSGTAAPVPGTAGVGGLDGPGTAGADASPVSGGDVAGSDTEPLSKVALGGDALEAVSCPPCERAMTTPVPSSTMRVGGPLSANQMKTAAASATSPPTVMASGSWAHRRKSLLRWSNDTPVPYIGPGRLSDAQDSTIRGDAGRARCRAARRAPA